MLGISIASNLQSVVAGLRADQRRQLDFVMAKTLTELAKLAQKEEKKAILKLFDSPTPFTVNAVAIRPATKGNPVATVYIRPLAARYLAPYQFGGKQYLGAKPADLVPAAAPANQYGNLPRNTIKKYMGRPDVYLGKIGKTYGLWQRPMRQPVKRGGRKAKSGRLANTTGKMKLIVAFVEPVTTRKRLDFGRSSLAVVNANAVPIFEREMAKAMASSR